MGLLAYSPMGFGLLSGKYHRNSARPDARINQFKQMSRYNSEQSHAATAKYLEIADAHGLSLAQLSLAFVNTRPFVTSNIIGATNLDQLKENIESIEVEISADLLKEINAVHAAIPSPAP